MSDNDNDHGGGHKAPQDVIELLSDDDNDDDYSSCKKPRAVNVPPKKRKPRINVKKPKPASKSSNTNQRALQGGLVLEEDIDQLVVVQKDNTDHVTLESYIEQQDKLKAQGRQAVLFHDPDFESVPASIEGTGRVNKVEKCRCSPAQPVALSYIQKGPNKGRPYHHCPNKIKSTRCRYFRWAFQAQKLHWYRFGAHTGHVLVQDTGFSANDLLQGRVGDCWFLSALAVIAERPDLIMRLFGNRNISNNNNPYGMVQVRLFLDGMWKTVVMDNFLPCIIDDQAENEMQQAINASMGLPTTTTTVNAFQGNGYKLTSSSSNHSEDEKSKTSSEYDPFALSDKNRQVLADTKNFLEEQRKPPINPYAKKPSSGEAWNNFNNNNSSASACNNIPEKLDRVVTTQDLAYSKAKQQQLWVPFLEKAYAKSHGCYQAISGGHIAEAFLDLTGAPTLVYNLHNDPSFDPKTFWYKLLSYHHQRLPMGCGTSSSAVGIIGFHAYSILDVREIKNIGMGFFRDKLADRTLGNVSGFTTFDGTVRLLRIRNPHGKGEWKGEFSDQSDVWEKLLEESMGSHGLERTMKNDGIFWIDYDSFLLGFSNVDVVLAFQGNVAKSFVTNFPEKKSNHRCTRAFEVTLLDHQPGVPARDAVELYVMGIQKTRRGSYHGRADRKVSYKICDMGILVGENAATSAHMGDDDIDDDLNNNNLEFDAVEGEMFGFRRNGHHRLILDRKKNKRVVVMPVNFGHPAATDNDRSFVIRFVADSPLLIRELPEVPRIDRVLLSFCFGPQLTLRPRQQVVKVLTDDTAGSQKYGEPRYRVFQVDCLANRGGLVFVYLCVNESLMKRKGISQKDFGLDLMISATCRGMMCRTAIGFLTHETLAKGKKFEASWRKFSTNFCAETKTRLLMVLVQSGQDSEMGSVICKIQESSTTKDEKAGGKKQAFITSSGSLSCNDKSMSDFEKLGAFNGVDCERMNATMFGRDTGSSAAGSLSLDMFDLELERALALSRGDIEMKEALELSKRESGPFSSGGTHQDPGIAANEDRDFLLALERSKLELSGSTKNAGANTEVIDVDEGKTTALASVTGKTSTNSTTNAFDNDLSEAITRSLQSTNSASSIKATGSETKRDGNATVDLISADAGDSDYPSQPAKKQKTENSVIEIIDDEDDEEEDNKVDHNDQTESPEKSAVDQVAEKRRLAAEAAQRRLNATNSETGKELSSEMTE